MTKRELTIRPRGKENVFGVLPWVMVLNSAQRSYHRCQGWTTKGEQCKRNPTYLYSSLNVGQKHVCQTHVNVGLMETDAEQERLEKWKRQVDYYDFNNEAVISEEAS